MIEIKSIKLQANKKNYWSHLWPLLMSIIAICILFPSFFWNVESRSFGAVLITIVVLFLIFCLPEIVVFYRYYLLSKNSSIEFKRNYLLYTFEDESVRVSYNDIEKVELHLSHSVYYEQIRIIPTDNFSYAKILLRSGSELIVTSLLDLELFKTEWVLSNEAPVVKVKNFLCWPQKADIRNKGQVRVGPS